MTVEQITAAMGALGLYDGRNTPAVHDEVAAQFGSADIYRVRLLNSLLGSVQREAMLADEIEMDEENEYGVWEEQLKSAGAYDDTVAQTTFVRWQTRRASLPMEVLARFEDTGPLPAATANASEALLVLLDAFRALHVAYQADDVQAAAAQTELLERAKESLQAAIQNTDRMLDLLKGMGR
ncbi:DUF6245 family protein [Kitasatospora sp. CM 4170]|uniref:DUF6245 family protein n=2 Tax=Kitasatospora aburaviensis TaxID=67265 RepID=A0ABW1F7B8_9ACTN|nr:DUF6245 family protein [Kitasatospora sp. CM 4170]WNM44228.1 DUF6245 family protein [Kitasatospora sp. CM 4170]